MTRDLRRYASQTRKRLFFGMVVMVFLVGDGLIYLLYGQNAALMGLLCLLSVLIPGGVIVLVLAFIDWLVKRANHE